MSLSGTARCKRIQVVTAVACLLFLTALAGRASGLSARERVAGDRAAGRPLVAHVVVALCDNDHQGIVPVPKRLGNGQDPHDNLYWGARFGVRTFFQRAAGWRRLAHPKHPSGWILERAAFARDVQGRRMFVVAEAWDGAHMREAIEAFLEAASGRRTEHLDLGGQNVDAGGAAHVVVFVGHNGLMDSAAPVMQAGTAVPARAAIVLACASRGYFSPLLARAGAEPLLLTTGLMAPEAYSLEAALREWFDGGDATRVRGTAAAAYAAHQSCGLRGARRLFGLGSE